MAIRVARQSIEIDINEEDQEAVQGDEGDDHGAVQEADAVVHVIEIEKIVKKTEIESEEVYLK